jgi:hypothetical protein
MVAKFGGTTHNLSVGRVETCSLPIISASQESERNDVDPRESRSPFHSFPVYVCWLSLSAKQSSQLARASARR